MRRVVNHFTAHKPGGIKVVIQEWCVRLQTTAQGAVYGNSRLVTELGASVYFDAAADHFLLADGTALTTSDPKADETRRRLSAVS